jgi:hypothetical protein
VEANESPVIGDSGTTIERGYSRASRTRSHDGPTRRGSIFHKPFTVSVSVGCCLLFLLTSIPVGAAASQSHPPIPSGVPNPNPNLDYVYNVSPSQFPIPSHVNNVSSPTPVSLVQIVSLPSTASPYGMINVSTTKSGSSTLWFESGGYDPILAKLLEAHGCNAAGCSGIPINWNAPVPIATTSSSLIADTLSAVGNNVVAAASTATTTYTYVSQSAGASWSALGSSFSGVIQSLALNATNVSLVSRSGSTWTITAMNFTGTVLGTSTLTATGSGATGIIAASTTYLPIGNASLNVVAFSVAGSDQVQIVNSTHAGSGYSSAVQIGAFQSTFPNGALSSVGATQLSPAGATAGEIALSSVGTELFLAYSSISGGNVVIKTQGSSNGGYSWAGPYSTGPLTGAGSNLTITTSPAGLVYASWRDSPSLPSGIQEAVYFADGLPMVLPTPLPGSADLSYSASGGPSILVDAFQRPVIAWPASTGTANYVAFTGAFLSANQSLALLNMVLTDPLAGGDFGSPGAQGAFNSSVATSTSSISSSLGSNKLCNAQNTTVLNLYSEITHVPLNVIPGAGTTCGSLIPNTQSSPLVNSSGVDAPNDYLAVYTDWLLEAEAVPLAPNGFGNNTTWTPMADPVVSKAMLGCELSQDNLPNGRGNWIIKPGCPGYVEGVLTVGAIPFSPTSFEIEPSLLLQGPTPNEWPQTQIWNFPETCNAQGSTVNNTPSTYVITTSGTHWMNVSVGGGTVHSYQGTTASPPWLYVTNLTPNTLYPYAVNFAAIFTQKVSGNWCTAGSWSFGGSQPPVVSNGVTHLWLNFSSAVRTGLVMWFPQLSVTSPGSSNNIASVNFWWRNSLQGTAQVQVKNLNVSGKIWTWVNPSYSTTDGGKLTFNGIPGDYYEVTLTATSRPGGWTSAQLPALANGSYGKSSVQTASVQYGAPGQGSPIEMKPPTVHLWGLSESSITGTTALVTWVSNVNSWGYVNYSQYGSGLNQYLLHLSGTVLPNGTAWTYSAQLHSLEPWSYYKGTFGIFYPVSGYVQNVSLPFSEFQTSPVSTVWEQDLPYDSISHTGGGAAVRWDVSASFMAQYPTPQVTGGTLWIWNNTGRETITVSPSELNQISGNPWNNWLNVTLTGYNVTYGFILQLNYSSTPAVTATSTPTYFVYQLDSSGDGLTNAEKQLGWKVVDPATNNYETVSPIWSAYSTNGLSNDFIEKEYGLNPDTVDTAASNMLDLWNLTFDLGANSSNPSVPNSADFQVWSELNSSFNPYNYAPYPGGPNLHGTPTAKDLNNISCTSRACPADTPYSSEVLWSYQSLFTFLIMPGNYELGPWAGTSLRGVIGVYNGNRTLTLWGKLSWGANPQVSSTPGSAQNDGNRISPLGIEDLSVQVQNLYAGGLQTGQGYAARLSVYPGTTPTGTAELVNYTAPVGLSGGISRLTGYSAVLPVSQTSQYQTLQIEILANESGTKTLTPIDFTGTHPHFYFETNVTFDMVSGRAASYSFTESSTQPNASLTFTLQSVTVGSKTPTFLWLPSDNSTVNGLPAGLERYTGEQAFDLVVVNASSAVTSGSIPFPWGGSYTLSLQAGLNNLLFPREQFLNSSFGEAIFEGNNLPYPSNHPTPPILDATAQSILRQSFGFSSSLMFELQAYWQNRSIASGPGNFTSKETGVSGSSSLQLRTMMVQTPPGNNTGGLPPDPSLYATVPAPAALQSISTLNITSQATLDLLMSALLTNTTAGVNGTIQTVTGQFPSLGFAPAVLTGVANAPVVSQGVYGPPAYNRPPPSSGGPWNLFCNAVSAVVQTIGGGVVSLVGLVYNSGVAAYTYLNHLVQEALAAGGQLLARTAATLVHVGDIIVSALLQALDYVVALIERALAVAFSPLISAVDSYLSQVGTAANSTVNDVNNGGSVTAAHGTALIDALSGSVAMIALTIAVVAEVVLVLLSPFAIGPTVIVSLILGLILVAASSFFSGFSGQAGLSSKAVWNVDNFVNSSESGNRGSAAQVNWKAFAESVSVASATTDTVLSIALGSMAKASYTLPLSAFVMDMISLVIDWVVWASHLGDLLIISAVAGFFAALLSYLGLRSAPSGQIRILNYLDVGLAGVAFGAALSDIALVY